MSGDELDTQAIEQIGCATLVIRGKRVLLDSDLAALYGVTTKALNQAPSRGTRNGSPRISCFDLQSRSYVATGHNL